MAACHGGDPCKGVPKMRLNGYFILLILLLFMLFTDDSVAALRCGGRLVCEGDTEAEVIYKCGKPDHVESWEEERISRDFYVPVFHDRARRYSGYREPFLVKEHVRIEEWTYNFGSTRFIRYLLFENGILKDISIGGYGY
jgi:hypothetical protein